MRGVEVQLERDVKRMGTWVMMWVPDEAVRDREREVFEVMGAKYRLIGGKRGYLVLHRVDEGEQG